MLVCVAFVALLQSTIQRIGQQCRRTVPFYPLPFSTPHSGCAIAQDSRGVGRPLRNSPLLRTGSGKSKLRGIMQC